MSAEPRSARDRDEWRDAVWESNLRPMRRLAALCYADHAGNDNTAQVWVGTKRARDRTGMGRTAWHEARNGLVDEGWLREVVPATHTRAGRYQLTIPEGGQCGQTDTPVPSDGHGQCRQTDRTPTRTPSRTPASSRSPAATAHPIELPGDWTPTRQHEDALRSEGIDPDEAADAFRDLMYSTGERRTDWHRTFGATIKAYQEGRLEQEFAGLTYWPAR